MQQTLHPIPHNRQGFSVLTRIVPRLCLTIGLLLVPLLGCGDTAPPPEPRRHEGLKLTLRCPDAAFADAVAPMVKSWEARTGAEVAIRREAMAPADDSDVGVIPVGGLGAWGEGGLLAPVPDELKRSDNPFQWFGLLPVYGERLVEWGGQTLAVPLTGDGFVLVYRSNLFSDPTAKAEYEKRFKAPLAAPATWEKFADAAAFFAERDKKPSLPPLPADPGRFFDLYCRVASSYDRRALNDSDATAKTGLGREALAFQFSVATGKPRLGAFGFRKAGEWLQRLQAAGAIPALPPGGSDDPVAALAESRAVMAVLSLDQLARLPRDKSGVVLPHFAVAAVPGARTFFSAEANAPITISDDSPSANYVPYYSGGRLGVVRSQCKNAKAAFELLAELGGPARGAEFVATRGLGAGPTRTAHLDRDRMLLWLDYGFDAGRSAALQDAMRSYANQSVKNPTLGLRGPDRDPLVAATAPLRQIGTGPKPPGAADAITQTEAAWQALDAKEKPEVLIRWRQRALGLH
jgi:ABC-type glycerol-3-phosphate transport system substrate-binding protein